MQSLMLKTSGMQRGLHPFQSKQIPQPCHNPCQTRKIISPASPGYLQSLQTLSLGMSHPTPWILGKQDPQGQRMHPRHTCAPKDIPLCNAKLVCLPSLAFLRLHLPVPKTSSPHRCPPSPATAPRGALSTKTMEASSGTHHFCEVLKD